MKLLAFAESFGLRCSEKSYNTAFKILSFHWHKSTNFGWQFQNTVLILMSYVLSRTNTVTLFPFGVTVTQWQSMMGGNVTTEVKLLLAVTLTQMNRLNLSSMWYNFRSSIARASSNSVALKNHSYFVFYSTKYFLIIQTILRFNKNIL